MSYQHLHDRSFHEDLYDKFTVNECRNWVKNVLENKLPEKAKSWPKKEQIKLAACVIELPLYFIKGERYLKREETINNWIKRDQEKDEFVANHPAPTVYCPKCNQKMELMVDELDSDINDENLRMMFLYKCKLCDGKKGVYSDGEPYEFKLDFCPKCHKEWVSKHAKSKTKITTKSHCPHCGYKEEDVLDLTEKHEEEKPDPDFEADKIKYCLSEKEGQEYRIQKATLPDIAKWNEEEEQKERDKVYYEKAKKIKKLTISELSDILAKELIKSDFKGLTITNSEMTRDLIITFTIQDTKSGRTDSYSRSDLKRALSKALENTNWKLMSDGVSYKLGLLSGRLRGVDDNEVIYKEIKEDLGVNQAVTDKNGVVDL